METGSFDVEVERRMNCTLEVSLSVLELSVTTSVDLNHVLTSLVLSFRLKLQRGRFI
jgi:hypothetical protein